MAADAPPLLEVTLYKGTTLPHIVVKRRCVLQGAGFTTYQVDKGISTGKFWQLHRKATLEPAVSSAIRVHERHLRKAGPLRALSAYARDKNVLKLYCFRVEWPDRYAPGHGSSNVELCFDSLAQAREWHGALTSMLAHMTGTVSRQHSLVGNGSFSATSTGLTHTADAASVEPSPFTSPVSSFPPTPKHGRSKSPSAAGAGAGSGAVSPEAAAAGGVAGSSPGTSSQPGRSSSSDSTNGFLTVNGGSGGGSSSDGSSHRQRHHQFGQQQRSSSGAPVAGGSPTLLSFSSAAGGFGPHSSTSTSGGGGSGSAAGAAAAAAAPGARAGQHHGSKGATRRTSGGHSASGGTMGVVVDERMVRWVPYKHANGMAIYYRQTPAEEGMPQASGEYMLSTAVQASPECCVSNLMFKADKHGSILSTAAFMEVLEDNGDMQVWHMVFHPAGNAGIATVLAAPRYTFMHQVLTSYEEGVYAVLFSSVPDEDVKPEWVERARARTQRAHRAVLRSDPGSGSRRALWKTPVRCNITGAITLSAMEGRSGRDSPQTLVTCIVRANWGGWLSSKSPFYALGQSLGLQEALMDRVLMRVMILKEDVEYSRFKTKPFQLLMMQQEEYEHDGSGEEQQQAQHQQQQQSAAAAQRHSAAAAAAAAALRQSSAPAHLGAAAAASPSSSSAVAAAHLPPAALAASQGGEGGGGSSGSRSAAAAAAAAAARVSAAASALAAHMTNPQQLWIEKQRGSGSGLRSRGQSASSTPPRSPLKGGGLAHAAAGSSPLKHQQQHHQQLSDSGARRPKVALKGPTVSAPDAVLASQAWAGSQPPAAGALQQQQQLQPAASAAAESFYSSGSCRAADSVSSADGFAAAASAAAAQHQQQQQHMQQDDDNDDAASAASSSAALVAAAAADVGGGGSLQLPYTEAQLEAMICGTLKHVYWEGIHDGPGTVRDVYSIRGPHYLRDRKKVPAGRGRYKLMAADLVATSGMMDHIGRFLPSVRMNGAAFSFVVDLIINYGSPVLHLVMVFSTDRHPNSLGPCPDDPLDAGDEWSPFDFTMSRFLHGSDEERSGMFKLIPHCAKGSWVVSQSVGTTPVILGRKLATTYHTCDRYIEVDVDVASTPAVSYIVKMVQGATRSMIIDHAYLLESHFAHELPETLIGAIRYKHLDMTDFSFINVDAELPFSPVVAGIVGQ